MSTVASSCAEKSSSDLPAVVMNGKPSKVDNGLGDVDLCDTFEPVDDDVLSL